MLVAPFSLREGDVRSHLRPVRAIQAATDFFRDRRLHQFLWFCLPAVLVATGLRLALMTEVPRALLQPDSPDLLVTAREMVDDGKFMVKGKRTFLVPTLYLVACYLPGVPALTTIAVGQHALGVVSVLLAGALCRLWLRHWKWAVLPATLSVAMNPSMLWYEHVLMAESVYLFTTLLLALAGTWFVLRPGGWSVAGLAGALWVEAGARPEGKLFLPFGFLLAVLVLARWPKQLAVALAVLVAAAIPAHLSTKTSQSGLLLLVSLVHLAPDDFHSAPGLGEKLRPIRDEMRADWEDGPAFPGAKTRRQVARAVEDWLREQNPSEPVVAKERVNGACAKAAMEIARARRAELPGLAYARFRHVAYKTTGERFEVRRFQGEQDEVVAQDFADIRPITKRLFGRETGGEAETRRHVAGNSPKREIGWVSVLDGWYQRANEQWCFPGTYYDEKERPGIPVFYAVVALGLVAAIARGGPLGPFHLAWGVTLVGLWCVIVLTGSTKPRFQFVFSPFLPIYCAVFFDALATVARPLAAKVRRGAVKS
jgi:hypothetical protein